MKSFSLPLGRIFALLLWLGVFSCRVIAQEVRVSNIENGATLRYPAALLKGEVAAVDGAVLRVVNETSKRASREYETTISGGRFKALAELRPGDNQLTLRCGALQTRFSLRYVPMTTSNIVRLIYLTGAEGDTRYMTQSANDAQDYAAKLGTAAKLIQCFTGEAMHEAGLDRRSFRLEYDADGEVVVHTVRAPQPARYYQVEQPKMLRMWSEIAGWLEKEYPTDHARNMVVTGFSTYDTVKRLQLGHTALGGGGLGLFSNLVIFSWPSSLRDVPRAFGDATKADPARIFDDSGFRSTFWGMAATTLGAVLHEMGHTFGLPHSPERFSIMSRGFDHFNRMFVFNDPPSARNPQTLFFKDSEIAAFERVSAERLAYNPFFEMDQRARPASTLAAPTARLEDDNIVVVAPAGLRVLGLNREDLSRANIVFERVAPRRVEFRRADLTQLAGGAEFSLSLQDDIGRHVGIGGHTLAEPRLFARDWRIGEPQIWPDTARFVAVSEADRERIAADLRRRPLVTSPTPFIDLAARFGAVDQSNKLIYALGNWRSEREQSATLLSGSDDALRVWLNGRLITEKLAARGVEMDADRTPVTLRKGDNELLVEVSNFGGGWGFLLRLIDEQGKPLRP